MILNLNLIKENRYNKQQNTLNSSLKSNKNNRKETKSTYFVNYDAAIKIEI